MAPEADVTLATLELAGAFGVAALAMFLTLFDL
jgi:hypothetical protein